MFADNNEQCGPTWCLLVTTGDMSQRVVFVYCLLTIALKSRKNNLHHLRACLLLLSVSLSLSCPVLSTGAFNDAGLLVALLVAPQVLNLGIQEQLVLWGRLTRDQPIVAFRCWRSFVSL